MAGINQDNAMALTTLESEFALRANMDTVMGQAYQELIVGISDITANEDLGEEDAQSRINVLIETAGATFEFSSADVIAIQPQAQETPSLEGLPGITVVG